MAKCNILWRAAQRPKSAEKLEKVLGHTLSRPGETRWNSLFDSLKQIWKSKDKMTTLVKELNIKNSLKEHEFEYIAEYLKCTEPVTKALDILQSEENIYFGILLPCILSLQNKLETLKNESWIYCQHIINALYHSVTTRFENLLTFDTPESENAIIAALTYPRFKNRWFSLVSPEFHQKLLHFLKREAALESKKIINYITFEKDPNQTSHNDNDFFDFPTSSKDLSAENLLPTWELEVKIFLFFFEAIINFL